MGGQGSSPHPTNCSEMNVLYGGAAMIGSKSAGRLAQLGIFLASFNSNCLELHLDLEDERESNLLSIPVPVLK